MDYVGRVVKKLYVRQEVMSSSPWCGVTFFGISGIPGFVVLWHSVLVKFGTGTKGAFCTSELLLCSELYDKIFSL